MLKSSLARDELVDLKGVFFPLHQLSAECSHLAFNVIDCCKIYRCCLYLVPDTFNGGTFRNILGPNVSGIDFALQGFVIDLT